MEKETAIVCCLPSILFVGIGGFYLNEKEITSPCGDKVSKNRVLFRFFIPNK